MKKKATLAKASLQLFMSAGIAVTASAAPGKLELQPLFLGTQVQPNIMLLMDDSGSMDWEVLRVGGGGDGTLKFVPDGRNSDNEFNLNRLRRERRELCAGYNVMAFDPTKVYTPWVGVDSAKSPYADLTLTTARSNPYSTNTRNISGHFYFLWNDSDGDGNFDNGECGEFTSGNNGGFRVSNLSPAQQINYANWYSYYRKREYVAKKALSEIIAESTSRMGLATLHNNENVGTIVRDIDDINTIGATQEANGNNKVALARNLFRINSSGGTPLRRKLEEVGKYFEVGVDPGSDLFGFTPNPTSPILSSTEGGQCQQNYTILMSDGRWNGSAPSVGNADANTGNQFDGKSYADTVSNTLADVAMYYYKRDLAPGLANKVSTIPGVDENDAQHMVTYTVAFGVTGSLTANPTDKDAPFAWPTPVSDEASTIDDMRHAAWNGRGEFLSAGDADQLIARLRQAIGGIAEREGAASAVAFNSTTLQDDTLVFQARFNSDGWNGQLSAFEFDSKGVGTLKWEAANRLDTRDLANKSRDIITYNGTAGVPFRFPADYTEQLADKVVPGELNTLQVKDLLTNAAAAVGAGAVADEAEFGTKIVDFLRGDLTNDGTLFRDRDTHRLGDIVNSSPVFVGAPRARYPDAIEGTEPEKAYSKYVKDNASRPQVVYVGANDGMLHAFDAETGDELMGYIPGALFSDRNAAGLHYLAQQDYTHRPYVDGSPVAADVFVNNKWRTYVVGGYRAGGKGIYVIDASDPSVIGQAETGNNPDSIVKFEFTDPNLGHTFSRPVIARLNNDKWAAIFGNGYNDDPTGDGKAKLFIIYLDGSNLGGPGKEKPLVITTEVGNMVNTSCADTNSDCNGLSSPTALDINGDGNVDRVYAGDLHGNMWAFDLSDKDSGKWEVDYGTEANPKPLFTACTGPLPCAKANRQPITSKPTVSVHPNQRSQSTEPNLLVYFGTGQYIAENDSFSRAIQSMYGVWDAGEDNAGLNRSNLQEQTITEREISFTRTTTADNGTTSTETITATARDLSTNNVTYGPTAVSGSEQGWYIDLRVTGKDPAGERMVVDVTVAGDLVFFNTLIPDSSICGFGGSGFLMFTDRVSGGQPDFTVVDLDNDGDFDDTAIAGLVLDAIPSAGRLIGDKLVISESSGKIKSIDVQLEPQRRGRRASWTKIR
ncbi:hypothetical protein FKG94_20145 [Exilibacterium tricleocarpae]|uniref:PilY1 beta-propeller domain-containing protein n=1 Tax=Exilibacterium tricleocarpae TaxID=2591008 RepID=A0A545T1U3_9GAMM|nr:PilC/PilY family type IV pilus protein [Exilibacterium tricleocarpae]TQV71198.1 hypothetical protein FKG94_20145 [Exilibacterium tricleocarpae]